MQCFRCMKNASGPRGAMSIGDVFRTHGIIVPDGYDPNLWVCGDCQDQLHIAIAFALQSWLIPGGAKGHAANRGMFDVTPSAVGGAIIAGFALGMLFGPLGAIVGFLTGGAAGQIFDLRRMKRSA